MQVRIGSSRITTDGGLFPVTGQVIAAGSNTTIAGIGTSTGTSVVTTRMSTAAIAARWTGHDHPNLRMTVFCCVEPSIWTPRSRPLAFASYSRPSAAESAAVAALSRGGTREIAPTLTVTII